MAKKHPLTLKTEGELAVVGKIADRAVRLYAQHDVRVDRTDVLLDVLAVHKRIQPLRLDDLLAADDTNFSHDIGGINRHLDRENYALMNCFSPRFSARA